MAVRACRAFAPSTIVLLGDWMDAESLSSHAPTRPGIRDFQEELDYAKGRLDELDNLPGVNRKVYIMGNHEWRLERYLAERAPALFKSVSLDNLLGLRARGWITSPYHETYKLGKLNITHDTGTAGMNAHRSAAADHMGSTIIGHCLPEEYEVLTRSGFVKVRDIRVGTEVLSYNNGAAQYTTVQDKVLWEYSGNLACFNNQVISQRMTSEHHLFTNDGRYIPVKEALESTTKADLVRFSAPSQHGVEEYSDTMLQLLVAYAADGHRASEGSLRFHLVKQRKVERLTALWEAAGGTIEWSTPTSEGRTKTKGLDRKTQEAIIAMCPDKQLPALLLNLKPRQRQLVIDELEFWNGSVIKHDGIDSGIRQFCSHKPAEIDLVQLLLMQHGIRSRLFSGGRVIGYDISEHTKAVGDTRKLKEFVSWEPVKSLKVGCVSTEFKNFFVRTTAGTVELTGNTHRLAYEVRGRLGGSPYLAAMFGWLGDPKSVDYLHQAKAAHWTHGFGLGYVQSNGVVHVVPVPIINGECVVEGRLIR